jgi:hypothetical protein
MDRHANSKSFIQHGGIVGEPRIRNIKNKEIIMMPGDTLILATDGIKSQFEIEPPKLLQSPEKIAKHIFNKYRNVRDDALVLVAQLL